MEPFDIRKKWDMCFIFCNYLNKFSKLPMFGFFLDLSFELFTTSREHPMAAAEFYLPIDNEKMSILIISHLYKFYVAYSAKYCRG